MNKKTIRTLVALLVLGSMLLVQPPVTADIMDSLATASQVFKNMDKLTDAQYDKIIELFASDGDDEGDGIDIVEFWFGLDDLGAKLEGLGVAPADFAPFIATARGILGTDANDPNRSAFKATIKDLDYDAIFDYISDLRTAVPAPLREDLSTNHDISISDLILCGLDFVATDIDVFDVSAADKTKIKAVLDKYFSPEQQAWLKDCGINYASHQAYVNSLGAADKTVLAGILTQLRRKPSSGGGGGGGGVEPPALPAEPETIDREDLAALTADGATNLVYTAPAGTAAVTITAAAAGELAAGATTLTLNIGGVAFALPPEVMAIAGETGLTVSAERVAAEAAAALTANLADEYQPTDLVYDLAITADGAQTDGEKRQFRITLSYADANLTGIDEGKLGVYWYNETTGAWEYAGGRVDPATKTITFVTNHFSQFAVMEYSKTFADLAGHWAVKDIEIMTAKHIVGGISATKFAPEVKVTRSQFVVFLARTLRLAGDPDYELPFADMNKTQWHYANVAAAYQAGIVAGTSATTFGPETLITREQVAALVVRALDHLGGETAMTDAAIAAALGKFTDTAAIENYFRVDVAKAAHLGIVAGKTQATIAPKENASRAEAIVMLKRMYDLMP